jgi:membrane protein
MVYGAFATMLVFLVWLYLSWVIVLAGATLTAMLPGSRTEPEPSKENV